MILYIFSWLALIDVITGNVLTVYLKSANSSSVACTFDNATYLSFYENLKQATTVSIQYTCNPLDGFKPYSAVITSLNISQSSDYQCLYNCNYTEPTITCTRQRKDNNILLSQTNLVPIVNLNDSNSSCVLTVWSQFTYQYIWNHPYIGLNTSCAPLCDGDNYVNQTTTTQITEWHITRTEQTLSTSLSTLASTENNLALLTSKTSLSSTLSPTSSTLITKTPPLTSQGHGADDTDKKIIIGVCVGGGLFLILVIIIVLICIKRKRKPHRKQSFSVSDNEINSGSKPKEQLVENKDRTEQEHPIVTSHIGNYINGIQIVNNKVDIPVNDYELPEYNTSTNSYNINNTSNIKNNRISEKDAHLEQNSESSNVDLEQKLNENNSDTEDFGYSTTEDVSTKNDVYSKLGEDAREFQNPYNVMPDDATDRINSKSKPFSTERAQHEDNIPASANVQQVDDSHLFHLSSGDIYAQVVKIKL